MSAPSRPVLAALLSYVVGVLALLLASLPGGRGELVFPLDAACITAVVAEGDVVQIIDDDDLVDAPGVTATSRFGGAGYVETDRRSAP
ncbi:MAG: hypothetical protein EXR71_09305 [Myxococcales bacterium]|nr:hypothetical protein [Myxococcales bacterium]